MRSYRRRWAARLAVAWLLTLAAPHGTAAFDRFGELRAEATFEGAIVFEAELIGTLPDRVDLLLAFPDDDATFVAPVLSRSTARYTLDTRAQYVKPNTVIGYQWRVADGDQVTLSEQRSVLHDDDREGLDWQVIEADEARVHYYGDAQGISQRFADLSADAVARTESLFGSELVGPVDIFVYQAEEDFFGALSPGAREWTGAQAWSDIRSIYLWLEAGDEDYLDRVIVHEIAHIVFDDATDNPYHIPAHWIDEGLAVWSEAGDVGGADRSLVEARADDDRLLAFDALELQFPADSDDAQLAYAQSATFVDRLIDEHGPEAIARLTAAYRDGASDAEAIAGATGTSLEVEVAEFFGAFDSAPPVPVEPLPLPAAPAAGDGEPGATPPADRPAPLATAAPEAAPPATPARTLPWLAPLVVGILVAAGLGAAWRLSRRHG